MNPGSPRVLKVNPADYPHLVKNYLSYDQTNKQTDRVYDILAWEPSDAQGSLSLSHSCGFNGFVNTQGSGDFRSQFDPLFKHNFLDFFLKYFFVDKCILNKNMKKKQIRKLKFF